MNATPEELRN